MTTQQTASGGVGLGGAIFLVFVVLKLTHYIDWSWWWVTAPLWGVFAFAFGIVLSELVLMLLGSAVGALGGKRSRR